jgi:raffinose/stachyose/melibiose transport system substrate-binding protein
MKKILSVMLASLMCVMLFSACAANNDSSSGSNENTPSGTTDSSGSTANTQDSPEDTASSETEQGAGLIEITVPHYKVGENVGAKLFLPQVERFNAKYDGVYKVVIEEVPQDMYADKIKQLGLQGMFPALVEGAVDEIMLLDDLIPNDKYYDLNQFLNNDAGLKARLLEPHLNHNNKDGKLFSINYPIVRPTILYYNEALYQPSKDIGQMTWDELIADLGDNKIAFMTVENAWTTMIALSSMVAMQPGGADFMIDHVPDANNIKDFGHPAYVAGITQLQKTLQSVASSNTVGAGYADAANAFMSNNAAVICNGSWMVGDFMPDSADKWSNGFDGSTVRAAALPGNIGLDSDTFGGYGWWIPSTVSPEEAECAWAFISFLMSEEELENYMLAEGGTAPNMNLSAEFLATRADNKLLDEYVGAINSQTTIVPYISTPTPGSIADVEFGKLLPKLIDGSFTPEEFCDELTKKAAEIGN